MIEKIIAALLIGLVAKVKDETYEQEYDKFTDYVQKEQDRQEKEINRKKKNMNVSKNLINETNTLKRI